MINSRSSTKRTRLRLRPNSRKRIRNNRHEKVDQPEIEDQHADDEEETRNEVFRVHHAVHHGGPPVGGGDDDDLERGEEKVVEALEVRVGAPRALSADLAEGTYEPFGRLRVVSARVYVADFVHRRGFDVTPARLSQRQEVLSFGFCRSSVVGK